MAWEPPHVHQVEQRIGAQRFEVVNQFGWATKTGKSRIPRGGTSESRPVEHDNVPIGMETAQFERGVHADNASTNDHGIRVSNPPQLFPNAQARRLRFSVCRETRIFRRFTHHANLT